MLCDATSSICIFLSSADLYLPLLTNDVGLRWVLWWGL